MLYIVATPIGNLEDITLRALRILKEADAIACEDTRVTSKLLQKYEIKKPLISYHQHSKIKRIDEMIGKLLNGENVALVTDAGTPGISDPGNVLVAEALKNGIEVVPIPGPSALSAMISIAGADMQKFVFLGFPPHKKGRETFFSEVSASRYPVVYYDSVHRVVKNLELLKIKKPDAQIAVGRELTKMFEEVIRGSVDEVLDYLSRNPQNLRGEFVVIIR
ncbi:MAG: 16S rRNA (cytidine(1402)-2'-O)-methyltransferase [Parcubacteria group bacterium]|jgi:16S rRNA (cytidine1402-2'-O)-methyltransferase|nr:16S rRNA (cytidine(1402)-2'-O)-methyltransferase [Candidatus Moranbacteria bacterium]